MLWRTAFQKLWIGNNKGHILKTQSSSLETLGILMFSEPCYTHPLPKHTHILISNTSNSVKKLKLWTAAKCLVVYLLMSKGTGFKQYLRVEYFKNLNLSSKECWVKIEQSQNGSRAGYTVGNWVAVGLVRGQILKEFKSEFQRMLFVML